MRVRRLRWIVPVLVALLVAMGGSAFSQNQPKVVMAYWENSASDHSLRAFASYLNQIPTDTFAINAKGKISGSAPVGALAFARSKGMQTFATVSNFGKSDFVPFIAHNIVNHPAIRAQAIRNMLAVAETYGYSGINVDFEAVPHKDRARVSPLHPRCSAGHARRRISHCGLRSRRTAGRPQGLLDRRLRLQSAGARCRRSATHDVRRKRAVGTARTGGGTGLGRALRAIRRVRRRRRTRSASGFPLTGTTGT